MSDDPTPPAWWSHDQQDSTSPVPVTEQSLGHLSAYGQPAPKRRLESWQVALLAGVAAVFGGLLVLCLIGAVGAAGDSKRPAVAATTQTASGLVGGAASPSTEPSPTAPDTPSPTPPPSPAPSPTPNAGTPTHTPTKRPTTPTKTTTKPAPAPSHTHAGTVTPGAFCASAEHYWYGVSAAGNLYQCRDNNGWRWTRV